MNRRLEIADAPPLDALVAATLSAMLRRRAADPDLVARLDRAASPGPASFAVACATGVADDLPLVAGAAALDLEAADIALLALLRAVETDPATAAAVRALQAPVACAWPTLALARTAAERLAGAAPSLRLVEIGAVEFATDDAPLPERPCRLGPALRMALGLGRTGRGLPQPLDDAPPLPPSWRDRAAAVAGRLADRPLVLCIRRGDPADRRAFAAAIAEAAGRTPVLIADPLPGLGAAVAFGRWMPIEAPTPAPGRRAALAPLAPWRGPRLVLLGSEGGVDPAGGDLAEIDLPPLPAPERRAIWAATGLPHMPFLRRTGPARLARLAERLAFEPGPPGPALGADLRPDLEPHAHLVADPVPDGALVRDETLRADLELLLARCRQLGARRPGGPAAPGVRALLHGPSGGGKTLACTWVAARLGLPLFRVDLASVVSKWIGETEENLASLLDCAESADLVLMFDEADSLFGARTEARDSSDRFANNQTNYLLGRIERFDGIALLTTNGRQRLDQAFARRLDQVIEVNVPGPRERREIWRACLPPDHALTPGELNRLAMALDLAGGHIRNIAVTAAVLATDAGRPVGFADLARATHVEYRKLGRPAPSQLGP